MTHTSCLFVTVGLGLLASALSLYVPNRENVRLPDWMLQNQTAYIYTTTMEGAMLAATNDAVNDMCNSYDWGVTGMHLAAHVARGMKTQYPNYHWNIFILDNERGGGKYGYSTEPSEGAEYTAVCKHNKIMIWANRL